MFKSNVNIPPLVKRLVRALIFKITAFSLTVTCTFIIYKRLRTEVTLSFQEYNTTAQQRRHLIFLNKLFRKIVFYY